MSNYPTVDQCPDMPDALPVAAIVALSPYYLISGRLDGKVNLHANIDGQTMGDFLLAPSRVFDTPRAAAIAVENGGADLL